MPRIITPPSKAAAIDSPREYALLQLVGPDGEFKDQKLQALLQEKTNAKELSFDQFAQAVQRPASPVTEGEGDCLGYAAFSPSEPLRPWRFARRALRPTDIRIQIAYAGICHSDIHVARNEWKGTKYPVVPGHEIVGIVTEVGSQVTKFKVGDKSGVGTIVNSCLDCHACTVMKEEQFCSKGMVGTYSAKDYDGSITQGGYSTFIVIDEKFAFTIPDALNFADAAPLLCAGITVYSPIVHFGLNKPGMHVGVVGLGGLGHLAVQFLKAFGVTTTVISTSPNKKEEAMSVLGADHFIVSKDPEQMKAAAGTLDGIIDAVAFKHDLTALMNLMKVDGTLCMVGLPEEQLDLPLGNLIMRRQRVVGSLVGPIGQTQDMLDFAAEKGVKCFTEHIKADQINQAYERVIKSDVRYRFVIDILDSLVA